MQREQPAEILIVDDTPDNLHLLTRMLGGQRWHARPAQGGAQALRAAQAKAPDLVLLDVMMPDLDGYEVCRRLKANPSLSAVPVIFISALGEPTDKLQGFAAGGVDFISKPFEPEEVVARVRTHLELHQLRRNLEGLVAARTSELALAHQSLQASEERLRLVIDATSDAIWDWNPQGGAPYISARWYTMLGYEPDEFPATVEAWRERLHADDLPALEMRIREHLEGHNPRLEAELRLRSRKGAWRWMLLRGRITAHDAAGAPLRLLGTLVDITERKRSLERIEAALREKDILLKEIYHRVKNNLQVVASLLNMQIADEQDERVRSLFLESAARVRSMSLVHEQLYRAEDLASIDFAEYVHNLAGEIASQHATRPGAPVELQVHAQPCTLGIETAIPCGLVLNELLTNAFRHGLPPGRGGRIEVALRADPEQAFIVVQDDGIGFPPGMRPQDASSLGWRLILALSEQIGGGVRIVSERPACVELRVPLGHDEALRYREALGTDGTFAPDTKV